MKKIVHLLLLSSFMFFGQQKNQTTTVSLDSVPSPVSNGKIKVQHYDSSFSNFLRDGECTSSVVPPTTLNGVFITATSTGNVTTYPNQYFSCSNAVSTPPNSIYLGQSDAFTYTLNFSLPVNNLVIAMTGSGVYNSFENEQFTFTTNAGNPSITSITSCFSTIVGNTLFSNSGSTSGGGGGGGIYTISASSSFTSLTISGPGGLAGSLLSICSNSVVPIECNAGSVAPVLSSNSIVAPCGQNLIDLTTITASNTPSATGVSLAWFTATPASSTNQLTSIQAASQPVGATYYAAFYDSVNNCYSATAMVLTSENGNITPIFDGINPICSGDVIADLPSTSNNGITGVWSPALNNTATTTYTFTPTTGQCALNTTLTIVVNQVSIFPNFNAVNPICSGDNLLALPTTSTNGITGVWTPALNNTATTTYTFIPDAGQCGLSVIMTIVVNPIITPTFNSISPICFGDVLVALPTTSTNGITGVWSPTLNNTATTTYTFTPTSGQCASTTTLTIVVNPIITPTFSFDTVICSGEIVSDLPSISNEGITGIWSPEFSNLVSQSYTFTPNSGQCSNSVTSNVTVNQVPVVTIDSGCNGLNFTLTAISDITSNVSYNWFDSSNSLIGSTASIVVTNAGFYKVVVTNLGCDGEASIEPTVVYCDIQNGISPDNNGLNDFFELSNLEVKNLEIYNRYGVKVYNKVNYKNEWYGKSNNGDDLPDGTYYYRIDFVSNKPVTGWIYINKAF